MKDNIILAIEEGMRILKDDDYTSKYKQKVNEALQLLLQAEKLIEEDKY